MALYGLTDPFWKDIKLIWEGGKRPFIERRTKRMRSRILMCLMGFLNDCHLIKMDGINFSQAKYVCVCVCVCALVRRRACSIYLKLAYLQDLGGEKLTFILMAQEL